MKYTIRRFSVTGVMSSKEIIEETVNGETVGKIKETRLRKTDGHKPVGKTKTIKYRYHV